MIGKLLGHTQVQTTARYAHLADNPVKEAATRIAGRLAAALGCPVTTDCIKAATELSARQQKARHF